MLLIEDPRDRMFFPSPLTLLGYTVEHIYFFSIWIRAIYLASVHANLLLNSPFQLHQASRQSLNRI